MITKREAAIISAYTGYMVGEFGDMQEYVEEILDRPVFTHEFPELKDLIKEMSYNDFIALEIEQ